MAAFLFIAAVSNKALSIPAPMPGRSWRVWLSLAVLLFAASGCERRADARRLDGQAMGTAYSITVVSRATQDLVSLTDDIKATIAEVEAKFSTYRPASEVSRFNAITHTGWVPVSATLCQAFEETQKIAGFTNGSFDITVAPLVDAWGFGPSEDVYEPLPQATVSALLESVGHSKLQVDCDRPAARKAGPNLQVDFSAWAKGLAIDRVANLLEASGFDNYLVELGGEIRTGGVNASGQAWSIALADPDAPGVPLALRVAMSGAAMATSGDYANYFTANGKRYAHVIDPRSGVPTGHALTAVTVIDAITARADALATALLVMGPDDGFSFATKHGLAASFLIRAQDGVVRRSTQAFEKYIAADRTD